MGIVVDWVGKIRAIGLGTYVGTLLSFGVGLALHVSTTEAIDSDAHSRFTHMARNVQSTLDGRIKTYADLLRGTSSLFFTSAHVTREQFRLYVAGLDLPKHFPGVETINFARHIRDDERAAFEQYIHHNRAPSARDFSITPPQRRPEYTVISFIEPSATWNSRLGVDLQARPAVALALAHARDTGEVSTSGTRVPIASTPSGLSMRAPVYRPAMPLTNMAQRRAAYLGSVGIGFSVERLANGVLDNMPNHASRLIISGMSPIEEPGGPPGAYQRVIYFDNHPGNDFEPDQVYRALLPVGVSGRGWDIDFRILKTSMHSELDRYLPWAAMLAGIIGTALLYALFQTLSSSRRRAIVLAEDMTEELRASETKLQKTNDNLRRLAAHAESIKESERKRIAREIHDDLGQNLLALRIEVDLLASRTGRHPRLHGRARWMLEQIDATIKSVRQIINDLRPHVLDLGLTAAVDWQIAEFQRRTGLACELVAHNHDLHVSDRCATTLFRILQESLTNVSRHAHATAVRVELAVDPDSITMTVSDNGVGLQRAGSQKSGSFGLVGIEERVRILGGKWVINSRPHSGTTIHVAIPTADNLLSAAPASSPASIPNPAFDGL